MARNACPSAIRGQVSCGRRSRTMKLSTPRPVFARQGCRQCDPRKRVLQSGRPSTDLDAVTVEEICLSATKILWGQILTVLLIVVLTTWAATQWTAWRLGFQPQLGSPWFELFGWPIYYPPAFFWWWYFYDAYAPPIFVEGAYIAASGGFISIAVAIGMSVWRAREAKNVETYGSARWARPGRGEVRRVTRTRWRSARQARPRLSPS